MCRVLFNAEASLYMHIMLASFYDILAITLALFAARPKRKSIFELQCLDFNNGVHFSYANHVSSHTKG